MLPHDSRPIVRARTSRKGGVLLCGYMCASHLRVIDCCEFNGAVRDLHPENSTIAHREPDLRQRVPGQIADELELVLLDLNGRPLVARDVLLGQLPEDVSSRRCFGGSHEVRTAGCVSVGGGA